MPKPKGSLTSTQYEILDVVWSQRQCGCHGRRDLASLLCAACCRPNHHPEPCGPVGETGLVDSPRGGEPPSLRGGAGREKTVALLAGDFVDGFFGGSARDLMVSLLGSKRLKPNEIDQLRRLLESGLEQPDSKKGN